MEWESESLRFPGILISEYRNHKLKLMPVGSSEYDVYIDNEKTNITGDDIETISEEIIAKIDGTVFYRGYVISKVVKDNYDGF